MKKFIALFLVILAVFVAGVSLSEPGDATDPLVTKSFVEQKISELKSYIDSKSGTSSEPTSYRPIPQTGQDTWQVVEVPAGGFLVCKSGTEIILRSGLARAVVSVKGGIVNGLSDLTEGIDLVMDEDLMPNHHIIVPRDDGRGAKCVTLCFFLVKGDYEVR